MSMIPTTAKTGCMKAYGQDADEVFEVLADHALPEFDAESNQVVISARAASVNPIDWKIMFGYLQAMMPFPFPYGLCKDGTGVVIAVGSKVTNFAVGDEVWYDTAYQSPTAAEFVITTDEKVDKKPSNLSFAEAASIPLVALTGYQAVHTHGELPRDQEGLKVLILGGAGGVGTFTIQWCKNVLGAYVATTASERNTELVTSLGADEVIDYRSEDWSEKLKGQEYNLIFNASGEKGIYEKASEVLGEGGSFVSITDNESAKEAVNNQKNKYFFANSLGSDLAIIREQVEAGKIKPVVAEEFALDNARDAIKASMGGKVSGKIVITIDEVEPKAAAAAAAAPAEEEAEEKQEEAEAEAPANPTAPAAQEEEEAPKEEEEEEAAPAPAAAEEAAPAPAAAEEAAPAPAAEEEAAPAPAAAEEAAPAPAAEEEAAPAPAAEEEAAPAPAAAEEEAAPAPPAAAASGDKHSLETLKTSTPAGVDPKKKEDFLADDEFEAALGMDRAAFNALAQWKKDAAKKKAGIF